MERRRQRFLGSDSDDPVAGPSTGPGTLTGVGMEANPHLLVEIHSEEEDQGTTVETMRRVVVVDVYVFGPFFGHWVTGDKYRALVIPTYRNGFKVVAELPQKGMHPDYLPTAVRSEERV